ncbi:MAG: ORF6N domain-containing protein [bacterium]|nr:ORF6N domain-containing protein [bacterium]
MSDLIPVERIESRIYLIRGQKVLLDRDLAELYEVETRALIQAVKRNIERFPEDFMFQLTRQELTNLKSHFVISSWGGTRKLSYTFTEQGVAMLSSVLKSKRAILVNIQIMRAFTRLREMAVGYVELKSRIEDMEGKYDHQFKIVFDAIKSLIETPSRELKKIGFKK